MKLPWSVSTLICVEWNALTYAGHTVWNVHQEPGKGTKRRPREEWVINRNTHEALISDVEAEALIATLVSSPIGLAKSRGKAAMSSYLLTGLLVTSDGRRWTGKNGQYYKLRNTETKLGKFVECELVDRAVLTRVSAEIQSDDFLEQLLEASRQAGLLTDPAKPLRAEIAKLKREKAKAAELALTVDDGNTFTRLAVQRSAQIAALRQELSAVEADRSLTEAVRVRTPN
jgi:hypothetical protein